MSLGLYFHLPFCAVHCTYCPFAVSTDLSLQDEYFAALLREIDARASPSFSPLDGETEVEDRQSCLSLGTSSLDRQECLSSTSVDTIYLGGGTPSRTSLHHLERLFTRIHERFEIAGNGEVSMEANPEDVTPAALASWRALGVNRLSIGVQSFVDEELQAIGRIHDRTRAIDALRDAVASGMRTNLDLILGLPQQSAESFTETLNTAVDLGAGHLSLYMLDLDEKTPLQVQVARGRVVLPEDDLVADAYLDAVAHLESRRLHQYEISNFARAGEECRHNIRYWTRDEYLGFGLGAHSFVGARRFANTRDIRRYIELAPHAFDFSEDLGDDDVRRETIFLGLRQSGGLHYEQLIRLCGQEGIEWIERGLQGGWLRRKEDRVAFTPAGFLQSNDFISQLF